MLSRSLQSIEATSFISDPVRSNQLFILDPVESLCEVLRSLDYNRIRDVFLCIVGALSALKDTSAEISALEKLLAHKVSRFELLLGARRDQRSLVNLTGLL